MEDISAASYYHHYPPPPSSHYPPYYPPPPPIHGAPLPPPHQQPHPPPPPTTLSYDSYHYHQPPPPPPTLSYDSYHYHQPPPPHPPPPSNYASSSYSIPPPDSPSSSQEQLRTLFIAGLPDDVKAREIYNLFHEFPGFQSSQLRSQSARPYGFAVFADQQSAVSAKHALHGLVFDLEKESTLYVDLAKSNSRAKRTRNDDGVPYSPDKKSRGAVPYSRSFLDSGVGSSIHMPGMGNSAYSMNVYPSAQSHAIYDYGATEPDKLSNSTPCPTLFVAKLGPTCSQQELTDVFSRCPGFLKLKMQNKNGVPVAFVDFKDVTYSSGAIKHLHGTFLYSSVGEGMRLEYAKSRMGLRRRHEKKE